MCKEQNHVSFRFEWVRRKKEEIIELTAFRLLMIVVAYCSAHQSDRKDIHGAEEITIGIYI